MNHTKMRFHIMPILVGMFAIFSVLFVWYIASTYTTAALFFPNPIEVLKYFFHALTHKIGKYTLTIHTMFSLKRVAVGFGLSSLTGIILGVAMGYSKTINALVRPLFNIIRPIPGLAWIPLAILWFGIGETTKYFIIFMGGFANIVLNSYDGTIKVNPTLEGAARLLGASDVQVFFHVILPSATPYIFAGLQVSLSTSWMAVLAAEMISSYEGAGWIINMGMQTGDTTLILVGMVSIAIVGFLLANVMRILERSLCSWTIRGR